MTKRIIDVLTDEERIVKLLVVAAQSNLTLVNDQVRVAMEKHEKLLIHINKGGEVRDTLMQELKDLGERVVLRQTRMDPDAAEEAYKVMKPDRYDVEVIQVPNNQRGGFLTYFVKMWWGNVSRVIYEGTDYGLAGSIAQKITDLTGRSNFVHREVVSKKDIWK